MPDYRTIGELRQQLTNSLSPIAGEIAESEAFTFLETLLQQSRSQIILNSAQQFPLEQQEALDSALQKRLNGVPLAYALGSQYFYNKEFKVSAATLIPRPDTETLISAILDREPNSNSHFLELGTGSGIIPESLCLEREQWKALTVDFSLQALLTATENCCNRITLLNSDCFSAIRPEHQFDFIVSNPPYIPTKTVHQLEPCVREQEPLSALDGGEDGLMFYRYLATKGKELLKASGNIYLEIGFDQGRSVPAILAEEGWKEIEVLQDLGYRDRVVIAMKD